MNQLLSDVLWDDANDLLLNAKEVVNSPKRSAAKNTCLNCKESMHNFLKSHLISNGVEPIEHASLHVLIHQCSKFDERFSRLDMSEIGCRYELMNSDHCVESEKLQRCISTVEDIKDLSGNKIA